MPNVTMTVKLTDEEIKKGKVFLDKLLDNVYSAGVYDRRILELADYHTFDAVFEAFCETLGLEV